MQAEVQVTAEVEEVVRLSGEDLQHVVSGYDGVLAVGTRRLYHYRKGLEGGVQEVPLRKIKTVTSSAQGLIQASAPFLGEVSVAR